MTEIPAWVVYAAGAFFVVNLLFYFALIVLVLKLRQVLEDTRPKISALAAKVDQLLHKVQEVAEKVEDVAKTVKERVDEVGGRARGVVGSAELVAQSASKQFERFSPFVVGALTAMRLVQALNAMRHGRSAKDATKKSLLERLPVRRRKKRGFLDFLTGR